MRRAAFPGFLPVASLLSIALLMASCASTKPGDASSADSKPEKKAKAESSRSSGKGDSDVPAASGRYASQTLADLEKVDVDVQQGAIDEASVQGALENYKQAIQLFNDPEKRVESLRRMADLAMAASTEEQASGVSLEEKPAVDAEPKAESEDVHMDTNIDKMLFDSFMQGAKDAKSSDEMYRMLDLAGGIVPELDNGELEGNYGTAILLYQSVIKNSLDPKEKADAYYLLAKAYDISGKHDESVQTLKDLVRLFPNSNFYLEAQFRLGEEYFSAGEFELAINAYSEVIHAGDVTPFYEQSIYKRGWGQYKISEFEKSLEDFFVVIDRLETRKPADGDQARSDRLLEDTYRVASMGFNNLDGVKSVTAWFKSHGAKPYENKVYRNLGEIYVKQERYVDAADTFDAFVTLYPDSDLAPSFSTSAIKALQDGGFPSQVLPAKEKFVKSYGIESKYWQRHAQQRAEYLPLLKSHLIDLAKHYHATAQQKQDIPTFLVAAGWYKQLLETDPADPAAGPINHLYAEALFSGQDFLGAVREFEHTAYDYKGYEKSSDAAYFGLVAYQAYGDSVKDKSGPEYQAFLKKKIDAGLRFAKTFQSHEKAPKVLQSIVEDQLAAKDVPAAVATAGVLVNLNPPPNPDLLLYGWETIANGEFDMGRYSVAEFALGKVLGFQQLKPEDRKTYTERQAASIYKQGEKLIADGKELEGAAQYMRVGTVVPDASIRANAEFDAATIYLKKEKYADAIPILEQFRIRFPKNDLLVRIPEKLAVAYEKTGNLAGAAQEMENIHDLNLKSDPDVARAALWQAAEFTTKAGNEENSVRLYTKYVAENPEPLEPRMEAQYRLEKIYEKHGDLKSRDALLTALASSARNAGDAATVRTSWLGAFATFTLAEPVFQRFTDFKLRAPLKSSLGEKRKLMQAALDQYTITMKFGAAEYVSAAQYRTAEIYRILAADLMSSERPRGLDELALEQYELLLEEQALPFEDQAIAMYTKNIDLLKQDVYDDWVKKSFAAMAILQPGRYGKKEQVEEYIDVIY